MSVATTKNSYECKRCGDILSGIRKCKRCYDTQQVVGSMKLLVKEKITWGGGLGVKKIE